MAAEPKSKDAEKQVVCEPAIIEAPQMSSWNDDRLDELSARTDEGFKDVKAEFKDVKTEFKEVRGEIKAVRQEMHHGFARVDERFEKVNDQFQRLYHLLVVASFGVICSILGTGIFG